MSDRSDFITRTIEEFRQHHGKVGGPFAGVPLLLLHSTGARTGAERVNPLAYQKVDGGYAVFASKGGAPTNPDWFHNLQAHPSAKIEIGERTIPVLARVADPAERAPIWEKQTRDNPAFAAYEERTTRTIPVVILEPTG